MTSVTGQIRVDVGRPSVDPAIEVENLLESVCYQKGGDVSTSNARMAHYDDGSIAIELPEAARDFRHRYGHGIGKRSEHQFLRLAYIEQLHIVSSVSGPAFAELAGRY